MTISNSVLRKRNNTQSGAELQGGRSVIRVHQVSGPYPADAMGPLSQCATALLPGNGKSSLHGRPSNPNQCENYTSKSASYQPASVIISQSTVNENVRV